MKFLVALILTALLGFSAPLLSTWWSFVITSFIIGVAIHQKPAKAFFSGFLGVFLLHFVLVWLKDSSNQHLLSGKVAQILPLGGSWIAVVLLTAFIGGLLSGFAALSGSYLRKSV
jgi:RsiW-degrading membrane proteinase PrsW (M82 family)